MGIRVVPGSDTVPPVIARYLLPHERQVITVRLHPAVLIRPVAETLGGLAIAALLSAAIAKDSGAVLLVVWLAWTVLLLRLVMRVWEWWDNHFVVTSQRLLLASGVFTKKVNMIPLGKVTDMSFQRSPMGQLLGYGEFVVESAGKDHALSRIDHLPYPEQLYLEVCGLIFKDAGGDD